MNVAVICLESLMDPASASLIGKGVAVLIAAGAAYYNRERALPEMNELAACKSLLRLRDALKAIAEIGPEIGRRMTTNTFRQGDDGELQDFLRLLEEQNSNLLAAEQQFRELETMFEIKLPALNPLLFNIQNKQRRITLIYSVAATVATNPQYPPLDGGSSVTDPRELTPIIRNGRANIRIEPSGKPRETDSDFSEIVDCIPTLTEFIGTHCSVGKLR